MSNAGSRGWTWRNWWPVLPDDIDLVITEGFKQASTLKFEVVRHAIPGSASRLTRSSWRW